MGGCKSEGTTRRFCNKTTEDGKKTCGLVHGWFTKLRTLSGQKVDAICIDCFNVHWRKFAEKWQKKIAFTKDADPVAASDAETSESLSNPLDNFAYAGSPP